MFDYPGRWHARALLAACIGAFGVSAAWSAAPVGHALDRPAVSSQRAAQSVLLGIAQAGKRLIAVGERGIVVISDDNAATWRQVPVPVSVTLTAVHFADDKHGYAVGHSGTVLATADGGETWTRVLDGRQAAQISLAAAQANGNGTALSNAERLVADGPDKPLLDLLVLDARNIIVIGAYGVAYSTTDGGQHWASWADRLDNPRGLHLYAIRRHGERVLVCGEQGLVRLSKDGGQTFAVIKTPYSGSFFTAELPSDNEIVVAGLRGNVLRSLDAGADWKQITSPDAASITGSARLADGSLVLVNQAGMVLRESEGALVNLNSAPLPSLTGVLPKRDGSLLTLSVRGILSAPNGGQK
ncbi:BNR domain-containing protein [Paraburkholderia atlantica]|uniref:BNR domain-containing protein n=1 Tax=Paraburkholderia atlantica TaxID=2654982 RepID=D5WI75_PARAM|nr:YCF48-related protein [Paraburkholderia atlantica]ADG18170.1 BNR domain-containing protein [Paraburkholderia atlantica]